jgi:uncharacterized protein YndB with AHSA1/START domain
VTASVKVSDDGPLLSATVQLDGCTPDRALGAFTDAAVLARWWGGELTADLSPGGIYSVWFAKLAARMTGEVVSYAPGSTLVFRWGWEHEPGPQMRTVTVRAEPDPDGTTGTVLTVEHGPYGSGEAEAAARTEHREGWEFFLPRLAGVLAE